MLEVRDFDIEQTLECGQCFNYEKLGDMEYEVTAFGRALHISQRGGRGGRGKALLDMHGADEDDIEKIWIPYFDLERDYARIKKDLVEREERLLGVIKNSGGMRLLNQEFHETLISFIISQNKNIPHIKKIVRAFCEAGGKRAGEINGRTYYAFPGIETLKGMKEEDFRVLKVGFRAPYIQDAVRALASGLKAEDLRAMDFEAAKEKLMGIRGVGAKVASCVLLFSLGFREAFPVDVWIKRVMEEMYFEKNTPKEEIEAFARSRFGPLGGYAQQWLYIYARENQI